MSEDSEMLSTRVPPELKDLVDADSRPNQEVVRAALWREFGGKRKGDLERRIDEKERRINVVEDELEGREDELDELNRELHTLRDKYEEKVEEEEETLAEAIEALDGARLVPDNPAVQNWAEKVDMTPAELINEVKDAR